MNTFRVVIKNGKGETAVIYHTLPYLKYSLSNSIEPLDLPNSYRVYNFINDVEGSLDAKVISKFKTLFERFGLSCNLYNRGKVFPVDAIPLDKTIDFPEDVEPRHGQDGGVVGDCN